MASLESVVIDLFSAGNFYFSVLCVPCTFMHHRCASLSMSRLDQAQNMYGSPLAMSGCLSSAHICHYTTRTLFWLSPFVQSIQHASRFLVYLIKSPTYTTSSSMDSASPLKSTALVHFGSYSICTLTCTWSHALAMLSLIPTHALYFRALWCFVIP